MTTQTGYRTVVGKVGYLEGYLEGYLPANFERSPQYPEYEIVETLDDGVVIVKPCEGDK